MIFALFAAFLVPSLLGVLAIRLCEGKESVLYRLERLNMGVLLGVTIAMFSLFLLNVYLGIPIGFFEMMVTQLCLILLFGVILFSKQIPLFPSQAPGKNATLVLPAWQKTCMALFLIFIVAKLYIILQNAYYIPTFFDDGLDNWNIRAKKYLLYESIQDHGQDSESIFLAYPPTISLFKAWASLLYGEWNESFMKLIQTVWFAQVLIAMFFFLQRCLTRFASFVGIYLLSSIPLIAVHAFSSYTDLFLAAHLYTAVFCLLCAFQSSATTKRRSFLFLGTLTTALMVFTKNEALLLYLPPCLLIIAFLLLQNLVRISSWKERIQFVLPHILLLIAVIAPWLLFKFNLGLYFGNAKPLHETTLLFEPIAFMQILRMLFTEGSWNLLFPAILLFIFLKPSSLKQPRTAILGIFLLVVLLGQMAIFCFTSLSVEAMYKTGYNRGVLHLAPLLVSFLCMLGHSLFQEKQS